MDNKTLYAIDSSGELRHWKYLRRERVNGKWRYYYADSDDRLQVGLSDTRRIQNVAVGGGALISTNRYQVRNRASGEEYRDVDQATYEREHSNRRLYIGNTPLSHVARQQLSVGMNFVRDLFSGNLYAGRNRFGTRSSRRAKNKRG